jgi:hypothetical protein
MTLRPHRIALPVVLMLVLGSIPFWLQGQQPPVDAGGRCEFEVVQSHYARFQGDLAGHMGRASGLENRKLQVALGDPIYRGEQQVGKVSFLGWSRPHGSLEVMFSPAANVRVCVGDTVWLALDGKPATAR